MNKYIAVDEVINLLNQSIRKIVSDTINAYDSASDSAGSVIAYLTGIVDCADRFEKILHNTQEESEE